MKNINSLQLSEKYNPISFLELEKALVNEEFVLHYQPQLSSDCGQVVGFEALIRWEHPTFGLLYPDSFISMAESTGFIVELGKWIIETACQQVMKWREQYNRPFHISINIAVKQLIEYDFVHYIKRLLNEIELEPRLLVLEITERATTNIQHLAKILEQLKRLGIKISIDDFGTGYNSIYYLKELPCDEIKIDRSFIHFISNEKDKIIVKGMITTAKELNLDIVAEGIETKSELNTFKKCCDYLQGYYISKPLSIPHVERFLTQKIM